MIPQNDSTLNIEPDGNWWRREQERIRIQKRRDTLGAIAFWVVTSGALTLASLVEEFL